MINVTCLMSVSQGEVQLTIMFTVFTLQNILSSWSINSCVSFSGNSPSVVFI